MPTKGDRPVKLVDTSVAIALVVADHAAHGGAVEALRGSTLGLAGHAAFETFSVLTRMPAPMRRPPAVVARLLAANFPATAFLSAAGAKALLDGLDAGEVGGGAVYDALVGAAAREHGAVLVTRDRRALATYRWLGIDVDVLA